MASFTLLSSPLCCRKSDLYPLGEGVQYSAALHSMHSVVILCLGAFVLEINQYLSEAAAGYNAHDRVREGVTVVSAETSGDVKDPHLFFTPWLR